MHACEKDLSSWTKYQNCKVWGAQILALLLLFGKVLEMLLCYLKQSPHHNYVF